VLDAHAFRHLRDAVGAYIVTDDPERVHAALGLEPGEPGVLRRVLREREYAES
jgi:hypothetical protein